MALFAKYILIFSGVEKLVTMDLHTSNLSRGIRIAPRQCFCGDGILSQIGTRVVDLNYKISNVLVIGDKQGLSKVERIIRKSLTRQQLGFDVECLTGECSISQIDKYRDTLITNNYDMLVGVGGGKAIDTAKAAADQIVPVATIPTSPATCAAWTPVSITYEEDGRYLGPLKLSSCPQWLFIDPRIVGAAPPRLLAAGIADAAAKHFEIASVDDCDLGSLFQFGRMVIESYYSGILRVGGYEAVHSRRQGRVTETVKQVAETCIVGPGLAAGLLSKVPYLSIPHLLCYALVGVRGVSKKSLHGERVAFGLLVQQILRGKQDSAANLGSWFNNLGLSLDLGDLGMQEVSAKAIDKLVKEACDLMSDGYVTMDITPDELAEAICTAQEL